MSELRARALALAVLVVAAPALAEPPSKAQCSDAHADSQSLRKAGKTTDARERLVRCVDAACPGVIKKECAAWLEEVELEMPSLVFGAKLARGEDLVEVKVSIDGAPLAARLDGLPVSVDPGVHQLRFETAGAPAVEQRVTVRVGEKNRRVDVVFTPSKPAEASAAPAPLPAPSAPDAARPVPTLAYVLAGGSAVALGAFAFFALDGKSKLRKLDDAGCKPGCASADVDAVKRDYRFADISLAVSVLALGAATYVFVTREEASPSVSLGGVVLGPHAGAVTIRGAF